MGPVGVDARAYHARSALIAAFTNGRTRVSKPTVLPVVDRPAPPAPADVIVEELELCSEPDHPCGQGWVPLRLMRRRTPDGPANGGVATASISAALHNVIHVTGTSAHAAFKAAHLATPAEVQVQGAPDAAGEPQPSDDDEDDGTGNHGSSRASRADASVASAPGGPTMASGLAVQGVTDDTDLSSVYTSASPLLDCKPRPVLILLHCTGADMDALRSEQEAAARAGYLAVAIDCRYHGRRCVPSHEGETRRDVYQKALVRAWREGGLKERPFLLDNLWDISHLLDYLATRPDADPQRVGIAGVSLGGMHAWLMAVADPRITAIAPLIGVQGFGWALAHDAWHARVDSIPQVFKAAAEDLGRAAVDGEVVAAVWDRLLPGLLEAYDAPLSLPELCPRPVLIANGQLDARCPMQGVHEAFRTAQRKYLAHHLRHLGVPDEAAEWLLPQSSASVTATPSLLSSPLLSPRFLSPKLLSPRPRDDAQPPADKGSALAGEDFKDIRASERLSGGTAERRPWDAAHAQAVAGTMHAQVYAQAAAAVNASLVLYVEPGAGHEERPGMWRAVRAFMDEHLRGVQPTGARAAAIARHTHPLHLPPSALP